MSHPDQWTDPDTGEQFDLTRFLSFQTTYEIKPEKTAEPFSIPVLVKFSNHCYTRSRKEGDRDEHVVDRQTKHGGEVDERVFCRRRWQFCEDLRERIENLALKRCFQGTSQDVLYRQEDPSQPQSEDGWYICMRLDYKPKGTPAVVLWVRSVHHRTNRPHGIRRHGGQKFRQLLSQFVKRKGIQKP